MLSGRACDCVGVGFDGLEVGTPHVDVHTCGDAQLDGLREYDASLSKEFPTPEVARGFGLSADNAVLKFERVADAQAADGELQLLLIAVERGRTGDGAGHVHGVGGLGFADCAVGMTDTGVLDLDVFGTGGVGDGQDAVFFESGVGLQSSGKGELPPPGAVGEHIEDAVGMFDDDRLFSVSGGRAGDDRRSRNLRKSEDWKRRDCECDRGR